MAAKFCRKCGAPLSPDDRFCMSCGAAIVRTDQTEPQETTNTSQPQAALQEPAYTPEPQITPQEPAYTPEPQITPQEPAYTPEPQAASQEPAYAPEPQITPQEPAYSPQSQAAPQEAEFAAGPQRTGYDPGPQPGPAPGYAYPQHDPAIPPERPINNKKSKKWVWGIVAAIFLAAVIGVVVLTVGRNSNSTADSSETEESDKKDSKEKSGKNSKKDSSKDDAEEADEDDDDDAPAEAAEEAPAQDLPDGDYSGEVDEDGKDSDGMQLPVPGSGESVYIGYGELPDIGLTKMAFVVSEDGKKIHDICIFLSDFNDTVGGKDVIFSNMQTSMTSEFDLPVSDETLGDSTLIDVHMEGDLVYVKMDYVFNNISLNGGAQDNELIPLGETEIWLKKAE